MQSLFLVCSGLLGRTSLRLNHYAQLVTPATRLFRPSRPDFIETLHNQHRAAPDAPCLFRPSRPDFIETQSIAPHGWTQISPVCSGLLGRTSLRQASRA